MTRRRGRVVVVGGGFGGLQAVKALAHTDLDVTLIDRNNYHLFQPLSYQVATGSLSRARLRYRCDKSSDASLACAL